MASCSGRNLIGRRTESDWTADAIRSGGGRNPMAEGALSGALLGGALVSSAPTELHQQNCTNQAAPTKQTGRECSHRTRGTHRTFWQRKPPTDRHRCAQIRRVWHPAIPTPPITQPNHLWKSVKSVGEYYHVPNKADGERVSHRIRRTHRTFWQRKPPTDRHGCAQIRRVWHPAIPTPPITQPNIPWKSVKSVGEYYHAGAAASAAPTKQTERVFPQNTQNTQNLLAEKASHR